MCAGVCRRPSGPSVDEVMTGLDRNIITQRFKLNNKVALITGTALQGFLCSSSRYCGRQSVA